MATHSQSRYDGGLHVSLVAPCCVWITHLILERNSMDVFLGRRRRKSEVVPMFGVTPVPPSTCKTDSNQDATQTANYRITRVMPMSLPQRNVIPESPSANTDADTLVQDERPPEETKSLSTLVQAKSNRNLNHFARSIISINRQQQRTSVVGHDSRGEDDEDDPDQANTASSTSNQQSSIHVTQPHDPWGHVLHKITRKTSTIAATPTGPNASQTALPSSNKRVSLSQMLKSREVKDLVKQAMVASHWVDAAGRSSVMDQWVKTSQLRNAHAGATHDNDDDDTGIESGFDLRGTPSATMYGRTLLLEESCRRAFAQSGENRLQMDLQALKAWFQMTKLKITTDFDRLQPAELDLLCRRMVLVPFHASEVVFRQGDEGNAMYIVFAGSVEVKVAQRVLGEKVEVTVCELTKGDYFGERALLHDDPRAATIVAKAPSELVRITRKDYNIMLKQDQQEFYSRMYAPGASLLSDATAPPMLLATRPRATLHQQTQFEYTTVLTKKKTSRTKADIDMLSEYLQTLKFFRGLPKTFVRELCTVVDFLPLAAGEYVFREGEVGDLFYIIFSGSVDVIVNSKDIRGNAQQTKLINLTEGAHFGELALMKGHGIRSATVLTREETRFLVICEKDYNATLRRMQKEDLAKRVGVLDRIRMFQTPEWTGDLLKEMSYVLSEQKLATGAVLFKQGDKAQQVYFVVRGELLVTKEIQDPATGQPSVVFVERIGRDRVVGDDAAAGANFNEAIYREVTVTASTPVELLVLSKYDVFHRLSRAARETLRAAAHSHVESVVYLDRFHKTLKWDAFKQKLLHEQLDHERLRKLLRQPSTAPNQHKTVKRKRKNTKDTDSMASDSHGIQSSPDDPTPKPTPIAAELASDAQAKAERTRVMHEMATLVATQSQLVDANEFLLLDPVDAAVDKCLPPHERSLAQHVTSFNADALPRLASRERLLTAALDTERRRDLATLREGNPLSYFDLHAVQQQQRKQQAEMRGRSVSARRLQLQAVLNKTDGKTSSSVSTHAAAALDRPRDGALNQFFHDNFIFSQPESARPKRRVRMTRKHRSVRPSERLTANDSSGSEDDEDQTHVNQLDAARRLTESLCVGDYVALCVKHEDAAASDHATQGRGFSPTFRLLRCCESVDQARTSVTLAGVEAGPVTFAVYVVPRRKFALMPRAARARVKEEALQRAVADKFARPVDVTANGGDATGLFASFDRIVVPSSTPSTTATQASPSLHMFAVVSMVLSKHELETAFCEEPLLCVHALLPTEAEAMTHAMHMPPQGLKNALLCILPVGEWIRFDEAYDWCVQIETDRRDKHPPPPNTTSSPVSRRKTGSMADIDGALTYAPPGPKADWQMDKEKAQRLHQFVCSRMGIKTQDKDHRRNGDAPLPTGFTPRLTVTLEDKLATLQEYLDTTSQTPLGVKNNALLMGKYRQMKRFGSILRSRIGSSAALQPSINDSSPPAATAPTTGAIPSTATALG